MAISEVVCVGILVADLIARPVDQYPRRGELVTVDELHPSIGGCAANTGIGLQKLGISTSVIGKIGCDAFGDFVQSTLIRHGVEASGVRREMGVTTSATMVIVGGDGERSFIHHLGANARFVADDIDWTLLEGAKLLHIAGHFLMAQFDGEQCAQVLKRAKEMGLKTALDTAWDASGRWMELLETVLPHVDYFVPSYAEAWHCARGLIGAGEEVDESPQAIERVARAFQKIGPSVVALKLGESGSYVRAGEEAWRVPPFHVQSVDATGAGDAFAAGFLAGVVRGFDWPACAELGNAVGACSVTKIGTVEGIRSLSETQEFIAAQRA
ncbi:MAG: hypothetical protein JWN98_993 [Abditibacteriota bacterium]|nr:hypothetical protein [Abditibacteriota bacterium]